MREDCYSFLCWEGKDIDDDHFDDHLHPYPGIVRERNDLLSGGHDTLTLDLRSSKDGKRQEVNDS